MQAVFLRVDAAGSMEAIQRAAVAGGGLRGDAKPQEVANLAWSAAASSCAVDGWWAALSRAGLACSDLAPQHVANLCWAFAVSATPEGWAAARALGESRFLAAPAAFSAVAFSVAAVSTDTGNLRLPC